jgi:hypothetical protein
VASRSKYGSGNLYLRTQVRNEDFVGMSVALRPAEVCQRLLAALDASEGRRRRRKRNTTPDSIGMAIKRSILEETVRDDPDADAFEGWLLERCLSAGESGTRNDAGELFAASGPVRAMALEVLAEWRLAEASGAFRSWLNEGARSDDAENSGRS